MNLLIFNALSWEQRKLFEMATFSKGSGYSKADLAPSGTPIILYGRMYTKYETIIKEVDTFAEEKAGSVYSKGGEVIVPASGETAEDISRASVVENTGVLLGGDINIIHPNDNLIPGFLALTISNGNQQKKLSAKAQGASIVHLHNEDLKDVDILYPTIAEQRKISEFFQGLDDTITLHQSKAESWKNKKSQLSTISWEQRKLGELGKARSGIGFPDAEQGGKEGVPFYKVSDMNNVGNEHEMVAANNHVTREQIARKGWKPIDEVPAIFFAKVGAAVLLNRKRLCRFPFLLDNNTMAYSIDGSALDADFAITLFDTIDLTSLVQVGALPSYNSGDVEDIDVVIPEMSEQRKIGTYFKRIDSLITLHHRKLNRTQICIKRSFLYGSF